jgi:hypothetical protein
MFFWCRAWDKHPLCPMGWAWAVFDLVTLILQSCGYRVCVKMPLGHTGQFMVETGLLHW